MAQFPRSARVMVFELPRPESGWDIATYQLEVTLDEGVKQHDSFKVIETIQLAGLEPGVPAPRGPEFYSSYVFMANTNYIDCMVHLHEAPVNTAVRGKLYSTTSGMLLGETVATTKKQGRQQVQLTWQNGGWRTGYYRLEVEVHPGNTLTTEIELIARITVQGINLCHQIAPDGGPVGTDWPFYPGDRCYCVAELGAPPPGVKLQATWYHKEHQLNTVSPPPYVTKAGTQQYAVFELAFKDKQETLTPGHYSVVVSGQDMIRAEQSFTVQPYPRRHQMMQTIHAARDRSMAFLKKYHLDRILPLLFLMLLFGLGFALADAGLNYTLDHDRESGNAILRISQALGQPRWEWAIGWFVGGIAYAVLQTRNERNLGGVFEDDAYKIIHYLLVFVSSALVWYTLSYLLFSVGYVWPTILLGFFDKVLWLNPLVAWFAPLVAFVISEWHRQDRNDNDVFFLAPVVAGISVIGVILVGWLAGLGCGLTLAIIGGIIGELLNVIGVDNGLGHGLMTIGSGIGFFAGLIGVGWYWGHEALQEFWKDWKSAKRVANDPSFSFLSYLIREDVLPFTEVEWRHIANITLRALGVLLITTIALLIAYRAVVVPVLTALYNMPAEAVIEGFVPPLLPALAVGLLIAWLVAFYDLYQHSLKPLLNAEQAGYVRRVALAMMTTVAVAFLAITIVSRTSVGTDLAPELAVFWTNRIAALVLVGAGVLCSIWLLAIMPDSVEDALNLDFDMGLSETMVLMAVALVVIFMPTWLWAGLVGLILLLIGGGLQLARRIA
ncbi:MAG: hypothetical protein JXA10_17365 [Anaerolineae bacterium]|nr:hypothetical protein [Anaerolineae bacterium]